MYSQKLTYFEDFMNRQHYRHYRESSRNNRQSKMPIDNNTSRDIGIRRIMYRMNIDLNT